MVIDSASIALIGLVLGWSVHIGAFVWWLSKQFSETRSLVHTRAETVLEKLREHENEDNKRFNSIDRQLEARAPRRATL